MRYIESPQLAEAGNGVKLTGDVKEFTIIVEDMAVEVAPGVTFNAWTFNGTVPGPTIHVTEGDKVIVHFKNPTQIAHTLHFHGEHDSVNDGTLEIVGPGEEYTYEFIAQPAGAFMYHCHVMPVSLHIRLGMYGMFIVDPQEPLEPAKEMMMVMSEIDMKKPLAFETEYYVINGYKDLYFDHPIDVKLNEPVRIYVANIGTTIPFSYHIHGTMMKVYQSGILSNEPITVQVIEIGPGNTAIVEVAWRWPGKYLFHIHGFPEEKGSMGYFNVSDQEGVLSSSHSIIEEQEQLILQLQKPIPIEYDLQGIPLHDLDEHGGIIVEIVKDSWDPQATDYYAPDPVIIAKGTAVTWINVDLAAHTVTSTDNIFDSGNMGPNGSWSYTFDREGMYEYYCVYHPWMVGSVIVK